MIGQKRTSAIFILISLSIACASSQTNRPLDYNQIVDHLEIQIQSGQKRALRDLGSLLDKIEVNQKIRTVLSKATFFTTDEIDVTRSTKFEFLEFYYDNEQRIQYSELLHVFYITPLEDRKINFELSSLPKDDNNIGLIRRHFLNLDAMIEAKKPREANELIVEISSIEITHKNPLLINLLQDERLKDFPFLLREEAYENILKQLTEYTDVEIVEIILQLLDAKYIKVDFAIPLLVKITNCTAPFQSSSEKTICYYQNLTDSLETLEKIRQYGYDQVFYFKIDFFLYPVDYYGKIIISQSPYPWIRQNALLDLKRSNHPRSLFYIAADFFQTRKKVGEITQNDYVRLIKSRTNVEIGIQDQKGKITSNPTRNDEKAMLNYLIYWASYYEDYEWDTDRKVFISKMESFAITQNYERLFRRFNSKNDSIALLSFIQLTEGDPIEIITLAKKYRQLLRNHNSSLPPMKYKYLEQLTLLTSFCRKNKVKYQLNNKMLSQLQKLANPGNEKERYNIENQLIESLTLSDVTALEYWSCIHEKNESLSLSVGRILDWFYSKNWKAIINDTDNLRLFLKKSYLFGNIGVEGICNNYLNKFDLSSEKQLSKLYELGNIESDHDILNQILLLLEQEPQAQFITYTFEDFLEAPLLFNQRDLKILPSPTLTDIEQVIEIIQTSIDIEEIKKLFSFLRLQSNIEYIPQLFKLIDDQRIISLQKDIKVKVADYIIPVVENIYSFNAPIDSSEIFFGTNYWKSLWKEDSLNYQQWGNQFYQQKIDALETKQKLTIEDINLLTESTFYSEDYKPIFLTALKKVRPIKNIRRLNIHPKLMVEEDLKYFNDFVFSYKVLDDIPKLFDIDNQNAEIIFDYLIKKSASFSFSEKGSFYNNLFRSPWLDTFIANGTMDSTKIETIKLALETYLNESSFLSEYEEQTTVLNISKIENIGKSLEVKIKAVLQMDLDMESKAKIIEEIIATISYAEIKDVLLHFFEINDILGESSCTFFHRDFGLPIFEIKGQKELDALSRNYSNLSKFEFYKYYLKNFGVDFLDKQGQLDFTKIFEILQFDIISPFVSESGSKRDEYIFGIIKMLEIHFDKNLGFHEKLNEYQTFYSFSSTKRAEAWINFLQQNDFIKVSQSIPPSFNQSRKEEEAISNNNTNR